MFVVLILLDLQGGRWEEWTEKKRERKSKTGFIVIRSDLFLQIIQHGFLA